MFSPIQIQHHLLRKVTLEAIEQPDQTGKQKLDFAYRYQRDEGDDSLWHANLNVTFGPHQDESPSEFVGEIEVEGCFFVNAEPSDTDSKELKDFVKMSAGSLLYSSIREIVVNLTSRTRNGALELPTIDPRMFLQESVSKAKHSKKAPKKKAGKKKA